MTARPARGNRARRLAGAVAGLAMLAVTAEGASSDPATAPATADTPDGRQSGFAIMSRENQAMQRDDAANPGMLAVLEGESLWNARAGGAARSCADCHGAAPAAMVGVAARYPAFDEASDTPIDLAGRINQCREIRQQAPALPRESAPLLALTAYVARQSRGLPIAPPADPRLQPARARGEQLYRQRLGQLNLACATCHDDHAGERLGASTIPQAHPTGYPLYRLEWQAIGSLQRRLRNCMAGVRAEPYAYGAPEFIALELFLMQRAAGMTLETPGVRP